jgi:hypothetical protein
MGQELVHYKSKSFYYNNEIISWVQKFMELYLSSINHPEWFKEVLEDLHGNFYITYSKYFFDDDLIGNDKDKLAYCIKMIDLTIIKMESISKNIFFDFIRNDIRNSWCDIPNEFYDKEVLNDNTDYKESYINSLKKLKEIMESE